MDGGYCSNDEFDACEAEDIGGPPETRVPSPPSTGDTKHVHSLASSSSPSPKRSRRSVQKRVVSIPISELDGSRAKGGVGEGAPPSDSWTWRKYGQKPIKGSPYPRGYYRCSSSKGCPARKQVERNRLDPSMIVVTYSFDHNHSWPLPKNHHHKTSAAAQPREEQPPPPQLQTQRQANSSPPESTEREEKFSDLLGEEESSLIIHTGEFHWFSEVGSTSSDSLSAAAGTDELLYSSIFFGGSDSIGGITGAPAPVTAGPMEERGETGDGAGVEDDPLFDGLGELPEYSVVFRRGLASATW